MGRVLPGPAPAPRERERESEGEGEGDKEMETRKKERKEKEDKKGTQQLEIDNSALLIKIFLIYLLFSPRPNGPHSKYFFKFLLGLISSALGIIWNESL